MPVSAIIATAVVSAGSAYMSSRAQQKEAKHARRAQEQESIYARKRAEREEQIAREKLEFEKKAQEEKATFITAQMAKRDAQVRAAAIAGFAASGIEIEEGSTLAVLNKIERESKVEQEEVWRSFERSIEADKLSYDWYTDRLQQETQWEITNRQAEASAYRSKGKYAKYGGYLSMAGAGLGGYTDYKTYKKYSIQ